MTALADPPANHSPDSLIATLADRYPAAFVAERWQAHKPLAIGVDHHLIATGLLTPSEVGSALSSYVSRRMYLSACLAGSVRVDLDGKPVGVWRNGKPNGPRRSSPAWMREPRRVLPWRPSRRPCGVLGLNPVEPW